MTAGSRKPHGRRQLASASVPSQSLRLLTRHPGSHGELDANAPVDPRAVVDAYWAQIWRCVLAWMELGESECLTEGAKTSTERPAAVCR